MAVDGQEKSRPTGANAPNPGASNPATFGNLAVASTRRPVERRRKERVRPFPSPKIAAPQLEDYQPIVGNAQIDDLRFLARAVRGKSLRVVSSFLDRELSGDLIDRLLPLFHQLEIGAAIDRPPMSNDIVRRIGDLAMRGNAQELNPSDLEALFSAKQAWNAQVADDDAFVVINDVLLSALIEQRESSGAARQRWIWRCHADLSQPNPGLWRFLQPLVERYDAAIFSAQAFAPQLRIPKYLFYPCIDPLAEVNKPLDPAYTQRTCERFGIDRSRPVVGQIAPFDGSEDHAGVIQAYRIARRSADCVLVVAGMADEADPKSASVLAQVTQAANGDPAILVLKLSAGSDLEINALQRIANVIVRKPTTGTAATGVLQALWKAKPTIAAAIGGIPNHIIDTITGALVHSVEGCASQIQYLLTHPNVAERFGNNGREHVKENFLITSDLKRWLLLLQILSGTAAQ